MAQNFFRNYGAPSSGEGTMQQQFPALTTKEDQLKSSLQPWIEKYRPRSMEEISSQSQVVKVLKTTIESQNLPHLLFYGPPGTGKTSTILALAKTLFSPALYKARTLELNASDERGIDVVRKKVKNFARTTTKSVADSSSRTVPPYKIIILDEADSMTPDAQSALRRTMEAYSNTTRFCLICNYVTRIIDPIASRCAKFRFTPLPSDAIQERIQFIANEEGLTLDEEALATLLSISEGDLRRAIMYLQSASRLAPCITRTTLLAISATVPPDDIAALLQFWRTPTAFPAIRAHVETLMREGYPATHVLAPLFQAVLDDRHLTPGCKARLAMVFADADFKVLQGADAFLQIMHLVLEGCRIVHSKAPGQVAG